MGWDYWYELMSSVLENVQLASSSSIFKSCYTLMQLCNTCVFFSS